MPLLDGHSSWAQSLVGGHDGWDFIQPHIDATIVECTCSVCKLLLYTANGTHKSPETNFYLAPDDTCAKVEKGWVDKTF